jgi:glycosyltransferase involved in cell wall biosynthesis
MVWRKREALEGIELLRVADMPSHDRSALKRSLSLMTFALSASANVGWLRGVDACLVYLTPATVGLAARILRATAGVPYVLYVQDLWPESITASGLLGNRRLTNLMEAGVNRFLRGLYLQASGVAAISPGMANILRERGARDPQVIYNWVDEAAFNPFDSVRGNELSNDRTWIMYAGGVGYMQGLETAIAAMAMIRDSHPHLSLAIVGDGVARDSLETQARSLGLTDRIAFLGRRPMRQMPGLIAQAGAQLVSLRDLPLFHFTVPSKVQSSMAASQPIICAVAGDAAKLVQSAGAGWCVAPGDASALAATFVAVAEASLEELERMGREGHRFYLENLGAEAGSLRLETMLLHARGAG